MLKFILSSRKLLELSLSPWLSSVSPFLDLAQGGFRPRRSALDQALCLHELIQSYYRRSHRFPVVAFLDIKSAYDTVDRRVIWDALSRSGAGSSPCLPLLVHLFDDVSVSVLVSNHSSAPFSPVTGVLQGSVLSPHFRCSCHSFGSLFWSLRCWYGPSQLSPLC
ncbi:hypothetical protein G6F35_016538 [Rhizopus arrhizus]|nr:hypothetical protein G6F35_016538 [Rhizopus arrhizus]